MKIRAKYGSLGLSDPEKKQRYMREYYLCRRDEIKARARANYQRTKQVHARRYQRTREARLMDAQKRRNDAKSGPLLRAAARARYARNTAPAIARANKRRARLRRAGIGRDRVAYRAFVQAVRTSDVMLCHWCRQSVPRADRRIDHVIPIARGGADSVENLCGACKTCNARKGDKLPLEWLSELEPVSSSLFIAPATACAEMASLTPT